MRWGRSTAPASTTARRSGGSSVAELVRQGYDDASRQFIEPVVGASGERLARPAVPDLLPGPSIAPPSTEPNGSHPGLATLDPVARRRAQVERLFGEE